MNCEAASVVVAASSKRLEAEVERLASTPGSTVSMLGELGVGKQAWARRLHARSRRAAEPFLVLAPGAALDDTVLARATGGSLYLRELTALLPADQARLAELLAGRSSAGTSLPDLRVIAASREDLALASERGQLLEELEYRLNVLTVLVTPLRERLEELAPLARHFLERSAARLGLPFRQLSASAEAHLAAHDWPGNLHELRLTVEVALLRCAQLESDGPIEPKHLTIQRSLGSATEGHQPDPGDGQLGTTSLEVLEEQAIRQALLESRGNRSEAARRLGIHRTTLYQKLRRFGLG